MTTEQDHSSFQQEPQQQQGYQYPYVPYPYSQGLSGGSNGKGVAGFILSLLALLFSFIVFFPFIALILGIIGTALSHQGNKDYLKNKSLAVAGLTLGIIALVISGLCATIFIMVVASA